MMLIGPRIVFEYCCANINNPRDNDCGTCLAKELLSMKGDKDVKSRTS